MKIEMEDCPSLIQSSKYWLSTFCVLGIKERGLVRSRLRKGISGKRPTQAKGNRHGMVVGQWE